MTKKNFGDMIALSPLNHAQADFVSCLQDPGFEVCFGIGAAGTGKTLLALYHGVKALKNQQVRKIIYVKPIVDMQGVQGVGFLPGDIDEKLAPMLFPVMDNLSVFCKDGLKKYLIDHKQVEPMLMQDFRGRSLNDTWVVFDEMQNASIDAMKLCLSRIGNNSKFIFLGDPRQRDVSARVAGREPLSWCQDNLSGIDGLTFSHFRREDIVRNGIIKDILERFEVYTPSVAAIA